jgi:hypothetical protein
VIIRSPVLMKYQDGMVFHAASCDGVVNALVEAARCEAYGRVAVSRGRSEPKDSTNTSCFR